MSTDNTGAFQTGQGYFGYGKYRTGGSLPTDHRYTGQKLDGTALRAPEVRQHRALLLVMEKRAVQDQLINRLTGISRLVCCVTLANRNEGRYTEI
jgi:hypothetical protein